MPKIASPLEPLFAGPVLAADRIDGWDAMVADLTATFGDFDAPVFVTVAEGAAVMAAGKLFYAIAPSGDPREGQKRLYLRTVAEPFYEDQGDAAAPVTQAQVSAFPGPLVGGAWKRIFSLPRLLLSGSGTVTIDARNRAGTITLAVEAYTLAAANGQMEYPYFGDDAVEVRATFTGTATAEII